MELYNSKLENVEISDEIYKSLMSHGLCGSIYYCGENDCLKIYDRKYNTYYWRLKLEICSLLQSINSSNVVDIKDVYFTSLGEYPNIYAYLMSYYKESANSILEMPKEYLIENEIALLKLAKTLTNLRIRIRDIKPDNAICTDSNIVLIDPDLWEFEKDLTDDVLYKCNVGEMLSLLYQIICRDLHNYEELLEKKNRSALYLTNKYIPIDYPDKAVKTLVKRLEKCTKPIDYLYK